MNLPELSFGDEIPHTHCTQVDPSELKITLRDYSHESFSVLGCNIRSCRRNFSSFLAFLSLLMFRFTIFVLCETWLTAEVDLGFNIRGYNQLNVYRNIFGGGIKVFYDSSLHVNILQNFTFVNETLEVLTLQIAGNGFKYILCSVYRLPRSNVHDFLTVFFDDILNRLDVDCKVLVTGDLNLNLFNPLNLGCIDEFMNKFFSLSYHPIIKKATRMYENNNITGFTLLDQIWTNFYSNGDR